MGDGDADLIFGAAGLVDLFHLGGQRHDLIGKLARALRRGGAQLALEGIFILARAADAITLRHDLCGFDHGHP